MNINELKNTWEQQDRAIEESVEINQQELSDVDTSQHKNKFRRLIAFRLFEALIFTIIILSLWRYIGSNIEHNLIFTAPTISALILNIFAIIGLIGSIGQIVLIFQLDYSAPIKKLQTQILTIVSHELQFTKLVLMSAPFYLAYVFLGFDLLFGFDFYSQLSENIITIYIVTSALLFLVMLWFNIKLSCKNVSTPWVKKSIEFLVGKHLVEMSGVVNNLEQHG
jgi:hypothetical protein